MCDSVQSTPYSSVEQSQDMTRSYIQYIHTQIGNVSLPLAIGRSEYPRGQVVMWWAHVPLVEIGLTDLPKPRWAIAHSAHPSPTPLSSIT